MRKDQGFTLTELLVVISIIGILAGIILVGGSSARRDARDRQRKADIEQIAAMLQVRAAQIKMQSPYTQWLPSFWGEADIVLGGVAFDESRNGDPYLPILVSEGYTTQVTLDPINNNINFYRYGFYRPGDPVPSASCPAPFFVVIAELEGPGNGHCGFVGYRGTAYAVTGQ